MFRFIDNGSEDDSVDLVRQSLPGADVIERGKNTGFAAGHNLGFSLCTTSVVLILNPDVVLNWQGTKRLMGVFDDKHVGAAQGKIYRGKDSEETKSNVLDSAGIIQTLTLNGKERGAGEEDRGQYNRRTELLATTGACCIYRMAALGSVAYTPGEEASSTPGVVFEVPNVFDEDFFAYKEDVDLGWRLNNAGWKVAFEPVFMGFHRRSLKRHVLRRLEDARTRYSLRNYCWMIAKNVQMGQLLRHGAFILGRLLILFCLSLVTPALFPAWREMWQGLPAMLAKRA